MTKSLRYFVHIILDHDAQVKPTLLLIQEHGGRIDDFKAKSDHDPFRPSMLLSFGTNQEAFNYVSARTPFKSYDELTSQIHPRRMSHEA